MRNEDRNRGGQPRQQEQQDPLPTQDEIREIVHKGGKKLVDTAERLGPRLNKGGLTTSQIRNIYGMVKQMELRGFDEGTAREFVYLKPKLAYAAKRAGKEGAKELRKVLSDAIDEVGTNEQYFANFVDFFEAILAYHVAAGGK